MCEMREWAKVKELHDEGVSKKEIARRLGMSRNTVARLLASEEAPRYRRAPVGSQLDPFKGSVHEMLGKDASMPATLIREHLQRQGYGGGLTILKEYVAKVRPQFKAAGKSGRALYALEELPKDEQRDMRNGAPLGRGAGRRVHLPVEPGRGLSSSVRELHPTAQKILAAATSVLTEQGYEAMTLEAIAARAGVNKSGVWYHFGGKQQLVLAVAEDIVIRESGVYGRLPPDSSTLAERIDLVIGSLGERRDRTRRFAAFYELLTHASRNEELRQCIRASYQSWYQWAAAVISPALPECDENGPQAAAIAPFASLLLDGIFVETIIGAPGFDFEVAWKQTRTALAYLIAASAVNRTESSIDA